MPAPFGYFHDPRLTKRETGGLCPEQPARLEALSPERIVGADAAVVCSEFRPVHPRILRLVHDEAYVRDVETAHADGRRFLDKRDTQVTQDLFDQALLSASAGCMAVDEICRGKLLRAFCAIRPPGHHANRFRAMGYCVFNNVAIAARYAQDVCGLKRILIVDWDLDPGNGTQEIFWEDPTVFTLSLHQNNLFTETGLRDLIGGGAGSGYNRNVPFPPGTDGSEYLRVFEEEVQAATESFKPELAIIAAGFDAHRQDPQSKMRLTEFDFATMTEILLRVTEPFTKGRTLSLLEGGYNVFALERSVREHCRALFSAHECLAAC